MEFRSQVFNRRRRPSPSDPGVATPVMYGNGLHLPVRPAMVPDLLERARAAALPSADDDFLVDWAGIRTRIPMLPWAPAELAGTVRTELPIPDDGYRSEAEEYAGLVLSLTNEREDYRVLEVGAGWAPWAVMGVALARRMGKQAHGIAVEADGLRAGWAVQHGADNGLSVSRITGDSDEIARALEPLALNGSARADLTVVQAAAWHEPTTLRFPILENHDMGGAVNPTDHPTMDNRGAHFDYVEVPTVTLASLVGDDTIDLMHIDLQGFELDVIMPALELIESRVRFLAVGTHNRYVEGMLQEMLLPREWALLMESPCTSVFDGVKPTLTGFTVQDGNQLYANSRFRDADPMVIRSPRP